MTPETKHPRGIYTLFFTEMWERMSYYGMRALLTLFMVDQVNGAKLTDAQATAIYGLYTALVYVMALPGGWVGDRLLGMKGAVWWGGVVIALGHITLGIERPEAFYLGLVIVAVGSGLLKSNMSSMVAQLYPEGGARRDAGYTLFYMGINIGAFIGMIVCPWLAQRYGWRWGFSAAAVGMVLGLVQFQLTKGHIASIGVRPEHPSAHVRRDKLICVLGIAAILVLMVLGACGVLVIDPVALAKQTATIISCIAAAFFAWAFLLAGLTLEEKKRMAVILVLFGASALFFAGFEQAGSSFSLFAERHTIRTVGSLGTIPAGQFQSLNSLMVIGLAPVVAGLWSWLARRKAEPLMITKFSWGLLALALGFVVAAYAAERALANGPVLPTWLISIYLLHTLGELFLSPIGLSAVSKLAPERLAGQMMGIWFLGSSLGNIVAGLLAGEATGDASTQMPHVFMHVVYLAGASGLVLLALSRPLSKLMKGVH
ncbi:MAG: peptide MFS transporter [Verrucomicrobiaceae bacterium]|nr:peptide MFS transporter [Verrucomicrobiaceae bacterium]